MADSARGQADHRALEVFERCAQVAQRHGVTIEQAERLITASVIEDAAVRFWERRGYDMSHATPQPGDGSPGNVS